MQSIDLHAVASLRASLKRLGAVVAEVDAELRYVWVDNPHPDFEASSVVGKRDDELIPLEEALPLLALKREAWTTGLPTGRTLRFRRSDGERAYTTMAYPVQDDNGQMVSLLTVAFDTPAD